MTEKVESYQLERVTCYMVVCSQCSTATQAYETENIATAYAESLGYKSVSGLVYCPKCVSDAVAKAEEHEEWCRQYLAANRQLR